MIGGSTYTLTYDYENHLTGVSGAASAMVQEKILAPLRSHARYYPLTDHLGSMTIIANSSGALYREKR